MRSAPASRISLSDVVSDPRFDRATAARTGYVPRSIAAVPLVDEGEPVGVLQVLDKHTSPTFSLRDMELMGGLRATGGRGHRGDAPEPRLGPAAPGGPHRDRSWRALRRGARRAHRGDRG